MSSNDFHESMLVNGRPRARLADGPRSCGHRERGGDSQRLGPAMGRYSSEMAPSGQIASQVSRSGELSGLVHGVCLWMPHSTCGNTATPFGRPLRGGSAPTGRRPRLHRPDAASREVALTPRRSLRSPSPGFRSSRGWLARRDLERPVGGMIHAVEVPLTINGACAAHAVVEFVVAVEETAAESGGRHSSGRRRRWA